MKIATCMFAACLIVAAVFAGCITTETTYPGGRVEKVTRPDTGAIVTASELGKYLLEYERARDAAESEEDRLAAEQRIALIRELITAAQANRKPAKEPAPE